MQSFRRMIGRGIAICIAALLFIACIAIQGPAATAFSSENDDEKAAPLKSNRDSLDETSIVKITASPSSIELSHDFDYRQLLLTGELENGQTIDLTRRAKLMTPASFVEVDSHRLITPKENGQETLRFEFGGHVVEVNAVVAFGDSKYQPGFVHDVQPVISRMGCNQGTCHGSKDGKNGFKLSLRGYDAIYDYRGFTDDVSARRINRAAPDQSLMLLKASGAIPHVGGGLTQPGERYYEVIRQWIANGVRFDGADAPKVTHIEVFPKNPVLPRAGLTQQIKVSAFFDDGTVRDVTREAFIESGNIEVVEAQKKGVLSMLRRGEAPILVRYEGAYATTILTVMGDRTGFTWKETPEFNYIDTLVYDKLEKLKVLPSELCTDADFIRRVSIDLTGLPPSAEAVEAFLADPTETQAKRAALVDSLLGSPEYIEHWTNKWADLLQVNRKFLGEEGSIALRNWIKDSVASNKPYNEFAHEILTASGSTLENPPAAYYKVLRDPDLLMENTTHLFLAVRFNCNKCHDHPFERWTQDQYYEMAAYFAQVKMKEDPRFSGQKIGGSAVEGAKPLVEVVYDTGQGEIKHDRTGQNTPPSFPYVDNENLANDPGQSRREQLAEWIVDPENRYFAKSHVNRLWGYMFGVGIIEPIDDIRAGNPPTNPELLQALEDDFLANNFDTQHILKTICTSRTYQHSYVSNRWNEDDVTNYSHAIPRRLSAEALYDAIHFTTGAPSQFPGVPAGTRAAELPDSGVDSTFLADFGKPARESSCECERSSGMVLGPVMKLVNGPTVANAINNPNNHIQRFVKEIEDDRELVRQMFLTFVAREPTDEEIEVGLSAMQWAGNDLEEHQAALDGYLQRKLEGMPAWEERLQKKAEWHSLQPENLSSQNKAELAVQEDNSILVSGPNGLDVYRFETALPTNRITGLKLEALADSKLPSGGPGRAPNGNFVLSELVVTAVSVTDPSQKQVLKLKNAKATFNQDNWNINGAIDGNPGTGWAVSPRANVNHTGLIEVEPFEGFEGGTRLHFELSQQYPDGKHSLGRFRFTFTDSDAALNFAELPQAFAELLATPAEERTEQQAEQLRAEFLEGDQTYEMLVAAVAQAKREKENPRLAGMQDLAWALINSPAFLFNR